MGGSAGSTSGIPTGCHEPSSAPTHQHKIGENVSTQYATAGDLLTFDPTLASAMPVNVNRYLSIASGFVADAMIGTVYDYNDFTGLPTTLAQLAAVKDATCAQVAAWITTGTDPTGGASTGEQVPTTATLQGIGSVTFGTTAVSAALAVAADTLCSEAWLILRRAGLIRPVVFG
jgi:hypothetical protein